MGACFNKSPKTVRNDSTKKVESSATNSNKVLNVSNLEKDLFPDMEEWDGDRITGEGIKRMKGYKCSLPINDLNKKREEFWSNY